MADNPNDIYLKFAKRLTSDQGQCVLILGPELSVDQNNTSYKHYFRKMAEDKSNGITNYFENDNLFAFENDSALLNSRGLVKEFYEKTGDMVLLELISRIRFPLIINLCPDTALNEVYRKNDIPFKAAYFYQPGEVLDKDLPYPSKELPVIYNIFGMADADTTLILNHSKLYEVIQNLLPKNSLPEKLEVCLDRATAFLLLGVKFDTWYYQLICHKLKLRDVNIKTNLSATGVNDVGSVSLVVRQHFFVNFSPDNPTQSIEKIITACAGNPKALREPKTLLSSSLYVSYAWKDDGDRSLITRQTPVDWAQKYSTLTAMSSLQFFRDQDEMSYNDSIDSFMTRIGTGKTVIRVISDKYLRSRYCMMESLRISQYSDEEKRIFTVLWEDVDLQKVEVYRDYWKEKCQSILENIEKKLDNDDYDHSVKIYRFIIRFINELKDKITLRAALSDFIVDQATGKIDVIDERKPEYEKFIQAIKEKIESK